MLVHWFITLLFSYLPLDRPLFVARTPEERFVHTVLQYIAPVAVGISFITWQQTGSHETTVNSSSTTINPVVAVGSELRQIVMYLYLDCVNTSCWVEGMNEWMKDGMNEWMNEWMNGVLGYTRPGTTWSNEMNFIMNHALEQDRSLALLASTPTRYHFSTDPRGEWMGVA